MNLKLKALIIGVGIIMLILIGGCVEEQESQQRDNTSSSLISVFPTQKNFTTPHCMTGLIEGELVTDEYGCLRVNRSLLVWPYGFSLSNEESVIQVIDDTGKPIARVGDKIKSGGGGGEMPDEHISKYSAQLPSDHCYGPYFIMCDLTVVNRT